MTAATQPNRNPVRHPMQHIISLFDFTGEAVRPWAAAGYSCHCFDIQHVEPSMERVGEGWITYWPWNADEGVGAIAARMARHDVAGVFSFTPCTDLAGSGARHWEAKAKADPLFQGKAVAWARLAETLADSLGCWYVVENPVGALARLWRKPDHIFNPCDFGGYIPEAEADHPIWPHHIPARDAYTKRTCLWTSPDFAMPEKLGVEPIMVEATRKDGTTTRSSPMWAKLGGKSLKTKNIRSATPRGFARAAFNANDATLATQRTVA